MRDLSTGPSLLSVNTATVRKQGGLLEIIEACARHGIAAISPWRDQVAAVGLERAGQAIKDAGLKLSGYCRGGLFPATGEHVMAVRDDNRRTVDEAAALGAPCVILVAGGLPQFARPGSTPSKDIVGARKMPWPRRWTSPTGSMPAGPRSAWLSTSITHGGTQTSTAASPAPAAPSG
jgi:sugar phosphate isomerase/epimerase